MSIQGQSPVSVVVGTASYSLDCTFSGDPTPSFVSWEFSGSPSTITSTNGRYTVTNGSTSASLAISNVEFSDEGTYVCNVRNDDGAASDSTTLDVTGSKIIVKFQFNGIIGMRSVKIKTAFSMEINTLG